MTAAQQPQIHSPAVHGARPGRPVLLAIAASGERPLTYGVDALPAGLRVDPTSGLVTGSVATAGEYPLRLHVANRHGAAVADLRLVIGEEIALTPPLGCNTWGGWGAAVTEANVRAAAVALHDSGLAQVGYQYVNIDDGWQGRRGGPRLAIQPNQKFGDPAVLCADLHALGLKVGTYSTPWVTSYSGFVGGYADSGDGAWERPQPVRSGWRHGSHSFAAADVAQIAAWGFDYFKYDWGIDSLDRATEISALLRDCGRDVVLELANSAPLAEAAEYTALAQMCRTTGDLVDVWDRRQLDPALQGWALGIRDLWLQHRAWREHSRPGHWNMPCPLRVGLLGGWDEKPLAATRLTAAEQVSHVSLWCLWSAPLIVGCPPERLDSFTRELLTNPEVLAVDQDPGGRQARELVVEGGEALVKELADGQVAVGLFNVGDGAGRVNAALSALGLSGAWEARDLWAGQPLGPVQAALRADLPAHGCRLLRLTPR